MTSRAAALEQVTTTLDHARDESATPTMGDGSYTEPPAGTEENS